MITTDQLKKRADRTTFATMLCGPDGVGKSYAAGSILEVIDERAYLFALDVKETVASAYTRWGNRVEIDLYADVRWAPSLGKEGFRADAYNRMLRKADALFDDNEFGAVIVDPGTRIGMISGHELLKVAGVATPGELGEGGSLGFYGDQRKKQPELIDLILGLTSSAAKLPKYVIIPWHMEPVRETAPRSKKEGGGVKEHADKKYKGITYEGGAVPVMDGATKYFVGGSFGAKIWCGKESKYNKTSKQDEMYYYFLLQSEGERECKMSIGSQPSVVRVENSFSALLEAIGL
jgi:hypothetical protein